MKKQIFSKVFTAFLVISFMFLSAIGLFANQAQALDPTGTIIIHKYSDENSNGVQDEGETIIVGYPVFISLEGSGERINPDTATNGSAFNNVSVGTYSICEELRDGYENTQPGTESFDWGDGTMVVCYESEVLTEDQTLEVSFGNHVIEENPETTTTTIETETTTTTVETEQTTTTTVEEETTTTTLETDMTTTTTVVAQVTTTVDESTWEEDELIEEGLEEMEEDKKEPYDWSWVLILALLIVGGALLFSKK
jgi:hypothetical protein